MYVPFPTATAMLSRAFEPFTASIEKLVHVEGIEIALSELQFAKALLPTVVMPSGIAMDAKLLHPLNAFAPMLVIEDEIAMLFKELHP